jgi:hypothetical protein
MLPLVSCVCVTYAGDLCEFGCRLTVNDFALLFTIFLFLEGVGGGELSWFFIDGVVVFGFVNGFLFASSLLKYLFS